MPSELTDAERETRRGKALELRIQGTTLDDIAAELGYASRGHVHDDIAGALRERRRRLAHGAEALREMELAKLDRLEVAAWKVLLADHPVVQGGKVVQGVQDAGPVLKAIETVVKLIARRAKLLGLDEPEVIETRITAEITTQVEMISSVFEGALTDVGIAEAQMAAIRVAAGARLRALSSGGTAA